MSGPPTSTPTPWPAPGEPAAGAGSSQGDLFDALPDDLRGRVDVLACNAPYVPTEAVA